MWGEVGETEMSPKVLGLGFESFIWGDGVIMRG